MKPGHIFVVDDHPLIRKGLCEAINAEPDLCVSGEAEGYLEALRALCAEKPDVLVLDLNLKDSSGWALLQQLQSKKILPPTLMLSVCDEAVYAQRLLDSGARGYLMKDEPIDRVLEAIRKILAGHLAFSDAMTSKLLKSDTPQPAPPLAELSDRELQVYEMLRQSLSNKNIGERLGISPKTIGTYKARLMEKLGVRNTHELFNQTHITRSDPT